MFIHHENKTVKHAKTTDGQTDVLLDLKLRKKTKNYNKKL